MQKIQCRWAPSLGKLEATHQEIWGTVDYTDRSAPCVFFGLYDLRDYLALWRHKGKAWVLWAGSDIRNLQNGFVFNDGKLRTLSRILRGNWWVFLILRKAEHWVENEVEKKVLEDLGVHITGVAPSFLGNVKDFPLRYKPGIPFNVYVSSGKDRQIEYGFDVIERIAHRLPEVQFHLYGASWETKHSNVKVHGRVPKEQMNREIATFQCGLRLNSFDGFSEITAKSLLMGQYPIARISSPFVPVFRTDDDLVILLKHVQVYTEPNIQGREYYLKTLNAYPWVKDRGMRLES